MNSMGPVPTRASQRIEVRSYIELIPSLDESIASCSPKAGLDEVNAVGRATRRTFAAFLDEYLANELSNEDGSVLEERFLQAKDAVSEVGDTLTPDLVEDLGRVGQVMEAIEDRVRRLRALVQDGPDAMVDLLRQHD